MNTIFRTSLISDMNMQGEAATKKSSKDKIKGLDFKKVLSSLKEKGKTSEDLKSIIKNALHNMSDEEGKKLLNELKKLVDQGDDMSKKVLSTIKTILSDVMGDKDLENTMLSKIINMLQDVDHKMSFNNSEKVSVDAHKIKEIIENLEKIGDILEKLSGGKINLKVQKEETESSTQDETLVKVLFESVENEKIKEGEKEKENNKKENNKKEVINNKTGIFENLDENEEILVDDKVSDKVSDKVLQAMKQAVKEEVSEKVEVNDGQGNVKETIKTIEKEFISKEGKKTILKTTIIVEKIELDQNGEKDFEKFLKFSPNIHQTNFNNNKETDLIENSDFLKGSFKTYTPDEMVEHITQRVKYSNVDGKQLMTMDLKPGELGEVKVMLSRVDGKMDVKIITESGEAKNTLLSNTNELKANLKNEGVNLNTFEITVNPDGRNSRDDQNGQDEQRKQKKNNQKAKTINFQEVMRAFGPVKRDLNVNV